MRQLLAVCLIAVLGAAACGGDTDSADVTTTGVPSTTTTTYPNWLYDAWLNHELTDLCPPLGIFDAAPYAVGNGVRPSLIVYSQNLPDEVDHPLNPDRPNVRFVGDDLEDEVRADGQAVLHYVLGGQEILLPEEWARPIEESELGLVVCMDYIVGRVINTCEYTGGHTLRYVELSVSLAAYEAATGVEVGSRLLSGPKPTPEDCGVQMDFYGQLERNIGKGLPSAADVEEAIRQLVTGESAG